jgi:nitrogen fixation protein FixH
VSKARTPDAFTLKGWHVLAILVAFFGSVFAVNGVFLYQALATNTGIVANEPYRKGLHYNERIAAQDAQNALGWAEAVQLTPSGDLTLTLADGQGAPVTGIAFKAVVGRPATSAYDVTAKLVETQPGVYTAHVAGIAEGTWQVDISTHHLAAIDAPYRMRRRLWIKS